MPLDKQRLAVSNGSRSSVRLDASVHYVCANRGRHSDLHSLKILLLGGIHAPLVNHLGSDLPDPSSVKVHGDPFFPSMFTDPSYLLLGKHGTAQCILEADKLGRSIMDVIAQLKMRENIFEGQVVTVGRHDLVGRGLGKHGDTTGYTPSEVDTHRCAARKDGDLPSILWTWAR